jgi:hypothetical protein
MSEERRESRITLYVPSGVIVDVDGDPPDLPDRVEDIPDSEWRDLGPMAPTRGERRSTGHVRATGDPVAALAAAFLTERGGRSPPPLSSGAGSRL